MQDSTTQRVQKLLQSTQNAIARLSESTLVLEKCVEIIKGRRGDIIVTGIGKSAFIGQKIAATLTSLGQRATFLHPVEAFHGDIGILSDGDVLLALSFSGESKEVVMITDYAQKHFNVPVIAYTKSRQSSLGKLADVSVEISIECEGSPNNLAPMASTTTMLVLGDMLATMLVDDNFEDRHFAKFHPGGALGLRLKKVGEFSKTGTLVPLVQEESSLINILHEINDKRLGATGVVNMDGMLIGVITDGDIRRTLLKGLDVNGVGARDIMTYDPKYVRETDSLSVALEKMEKHKIGHLFVVDTQIRPLGIIHIHDIVESAFIQ